MHDPEEQRLRLSAAADQRLPAVAPGRRILAMPLFVTTGVAAAVAVAASWKLAALLAILTLIVGGALLLALAVERYGFPLLDRIVTAMHQWLRRRDDRWSQAVLGPLDGFAAELPLVALFGVAMMAGMWAFFAVLEDVVSGDPLVAFDHAVFRLLQSLRSTAGDFLLIAVTELGDRQVIIAVVAAAAAGLLLLRRRWAAVYLVLAALGSTLFVHGLKMVLHRARPLDLYDGVSEFSFPSGHATSSVVVYGFLAILIARSAAPYLRRVIIGAALSLVVLIAFSRLYLGAHWFSDVAAGMSFGTAWITALAILYVRHDREPLPGNHLVALVCVALVVAGGWHVARSHAADLVRYVPASSASGSKMQR